MGNTGEWGMTRFIREVVLLLVMDLELADDDEEVDRGLDLRWGLPLTFDTLTISMP